MAKRTKILLTCLICGNNFEALSYAAKYCPACKARYDEELKLERARKSYHRRKARVTNAPKTIYQIIREMEEYNRQHGVSLTYGQYVQLLKEGKK